jgi:hypothetical protein
MVECGGKNRFNLTFVVEPLQEETAEVTGCLMLDAVARPSVPPVEKSK